MSLSVVIIAKDEADRITDCILAAKQVSHDILVLDSGSTDDTVAVARQAGATVHSVTWQGYGTTKNLGHSLVQHDWILSLDADEVLSAELIDSISALQLHRGTVYLLDRIVNLDGQLIKYSGWYPDWVYRLFHKADSKWSEVAVHEKLQSPANSKLVRLQGKLIHKSFRSVEHFLSKTDHYAQLAARQWIQDGKKPSLIKKLLGPQWKFFQTYYLYRGYKDGKIGRTIASVVSDGVRKKLSYYHRWKDHNS